MNTLVVLVLGVVALVALLLFLPMALSAVLHVVGPKPSASDLIAAEALRKNQEACFAAYRKPTPATQAKQD